MLTRITHELSCVTIPLPDTPLKSLNCYILRPEDGGRCLLVDTGFHHPLCQEALLQGMEEAGLVPENTDVFLTHAHADHIGNAALLQKMGCRLYLSTRDDQMHRDWPKTSKKLLARALHEGLPQDFLAAPPSPILHYGPEAFTAIPVDEGDVLSYGNWHFRCVMTPGHTPGHLCLYEPAKKVLLLGDHVLYDISPNICNFDGVPDSLGDYLESLRRIRRLSVELALPGHRGFGEVSLAQRVDQLLDHHKRRLDKTLQILEAAPGSNAYQVAARLPWKIRAASWEDFPSGQKWFALGETLAHLDYLRLRGRVRCRQVNGIWVYQKP